MLTERWSKVLASSATLAKKRRKLIPIPNISLKCSSLRRIHSWNQAYVFRVTRWGSDVGMPLMSRTILAFSAEMVARFVS